MRRLYYRQREKAAFGIDDKKLHFILKNGTSDSRKNWFNVGEYKKLPNEVGGNETCPPENVKTEMKKLLSAYNGGERKTLDEILEFHKNLSRFTRFRTATAVSED